MEIYKITNLINNKVYIGQHCGKNKYYFGGGTILKSAIKKYNKENFKKEIIISGDFNQQLTDELEKHYIQLNNSTNKKVGYNIQKGGSSTSEERRLKQSNIKKDRKLSDEVKLNMSIAQKKRVTPEFKEWCKNRMIGNKIMNGRKRDVGSIKKQSNTWSYLQSLKSKEEKLKSSQKRLKTVDLKQIGEAISKTKQRNKKEGWENNQSLSILQLTLDGLPIKLWSSAYQAEVQKGYLNGRISGVCKKLYGQKTYKGYDWKYATKEKLNKSI